MDAEIGLKDYFEIGSNEQSFKSINSKCRIQVKHNCFDLTLIYIVMFRYSIESVSRLNLTP